MCVCVCIYIYIKRCPTQSELRYKCESRPWVASGSGPTVSETAI